MAKLQLIVNDNKSDHWIEVSPTNYTVNKIGSIQYGFQSRFVKNGISYEVLTEVTRCSLIKRIACIVVSFLTLGILPLFFLQLRSICFEGNEYHKYAFENPTVESLQKRIVSAIQSLGTNTDDLHEDFSSSEMFLGIQSFQIFSVLVSDIIANVTREKCAFKVDALVSRIFGNLCGGLFGGVGSYFASKKINEINKYYFKSSNIGIASTMLNTAFMSSVGGRIAIGQLSKEYAAYILIAISLSLFTEQALFLLMDSKSLRRGDKYPKV